MTLFILTAVMIRFSDKATMVIESDGMVVLTLIKDGQTMIDYELEITLTPGSAGTCGYKIIIHL